MRRAAASCSARCAAATQRRAAADAHGETARAENLLGERAAHAFGGRHERPEAHRTAPQRERDEQQQHDDDRSAVLPHELEQRAHVLFRHEHDVIADAQVRRGRDQHLAVLALEQLAVDERHGVDDRYGALDRRARARPECRPSLLSNHTIPRLARPSQLA